MDRENIGNISPEEKLLSYIDIGDLLLRVSDAMVDIFDADFARIWLIKDADLCTTGCIHASETAGSDVCQNRTRCLHLMVSSGRYSAVNGTHQRVPLGCYKVGRLAQGDQTLFITNDVAHDPFVHDHAWAEELGLTSFAGFRLLSPDNTATGVLAFFKKNPLSSPDEALIQELTNTVSHAINAALASQEIRESEAKFKGLFEGANDAIVIMDHSIIVDCNHKTEDLLGLPRERIIGHSPADFAPMQQPDNRSSAGRVQESIDIVLSGGTQRIEWVHKNPDNSLTNTEVSLSRITIHGRFYLLGIIRDITERKEAENVLKKAHTLLESKVRERTAALRESEEKLQLKLNSLLSPDSDLTEMELSNILDIGEVQSLLDNFSHLTGITIAILDLKGNVIEASGWQDICTKFHRVHQKTAEYCTESDLHLSENLQPGQYVSYQCKNHLWDVITPLYISEKHVGNIFTGQFFYDDEIIDESVFIDQAERYGFDREEYLSALHRIPRFSRSYVDTIMEFQVQFTGYISRLSFSNLKLARIMAEENEIREALVQSGQLLSDIINHLPDATLAINLKGEVITWNKAMEEMTGVKAEDIVGKGNYEYAIPLYGYRRPILIDWIFTPCEEVEKEYTVIKLEGNLIVAEVDITLPDGRDISLWGKATPLYDKDGNKVGAIESIRDVTSQKKAIVALQESEDKFRDLSEKSLTGIYLIQDEIFRYVNAKLAEIFEYPVSELTDIMGPKELIIQDDWPKLEENLRKRIEGEIESINYEMRGVTKSGKIIFIEVFGSRTIFKGRPAVIGSLLDITVRKKAEEDLQRLNEELEMRVAQRTAELSKAQGAYQQANKKLHLLSSITRHDINNQLQGMISYLDFSRDYVNDAKKIAGFIEKEMIIADSIYRQISFTKDYEEMGIHSPTWQNVHSIIKASVAQLPVGNIRVTVGDPEIEIFADPLLQKVFYNLIDNALRYGGEKMTMIHTSNYNQEANRIIIVEDDGNGISGEDKKKLFSKGFGKHTGLGLFLSREILSITGITITENGTPGSGARFEITVPQGMFRTEDNS